jgi:hypothetical protein
MTEEMKLFLKELADLMQKHDVELEATETSSGYSNHVDGIEVEQQGIYANGKTYREQSSFRLYRYTDAESIRELIEKTVVG